MDNHYKKRISKFLSLILRHQPEKIGLRLDENGWANVNAILEQTQLQFSFKDLEDVVATNDKQRFSFNPNKTKIRANQGHSLQTVDLNLKAQTPPPFLYHGTVSKFLDAIKIEGLKKMNRQHVHLSKDLETAQKVGARRGKPFILKVDTLEMHSQGYVFFKSENGVWLTEKVPVEFINFEDN
jgi:putative RNA 2'-phosphotransferase